MDILELEEKRKLLELWAARQQANRPYNIMMQSLNQPQQVPLTEENINQPQQEPLTEGNINYGPALEEAYRRAGRFLAPAIFRAEEMANLPPQQRRVMAGQEAMGLGMPLMFAGPKAAGYEAAQRKFSSLYDKMPRFEISDEAMKVIKPWRGSGNLDEFISHPELFKNYPHLKDVKVYITSELGPGQAQLSGSGKQIMIGEGSPSSYAGNFVHEIQHAIQEYEGFAKGGSPDRAFNEAYKYAQRMFPYMSNADLSTYAGKVANKNYQKLSGEIESRDAAFRRLYTDYERRTTQPYISQGILPEEAILRFK